MWYKARSIGHQVRIKFTNNDLLTKRSKHYILGSVQPYNYLQKKTDFSIL